MSYSIYAAELPSALLRGVCAELTDSVRSLADESVPRSIVRTGPITFVTGSLAGIIGW